MNCMSYKKKTLILTSATFFIVFVSMMAGALMYGKAMNDTPETRYEHRAYKEMLTEYHQFKSVNAFLFMGSGLLHILVSIVKED
jgi:uncharacterized protein YpmB